MKRKIIAWILLALFLIPLIAMIFCGCSKKEKPMADAILPSVSVGATADATGETETVYSQCAVIDIAVGEDGSYCLMSEISVDMMDGEPIGIVISNPTLLAFQISSEHDNGVFLFDLNDGFEAVENLKEVQKALILRGDTELAAQVKSVIDSFDRAGPICGEST